MKEQFKAPKKIQLNNKEIANLSDAQFKTGNQDAHRTDWAWSQNEGKSERYSNWNKGKYTGNQQWQEGNKDSNEQFGPEEKINIQPEQNEETRIQKNEGRLRNLWDNFKHSNIWLIGVPEEEE